eukprot:EG_transcript_25568
MVSYNRRPKFLARTSDIPQATLQSTPRQPSGTSTQNPRCSHFASATLQKSMQHTGKHRVSHGEVKISVRVKVTALSMTASLGLCPLELVQTPLAHCHAGGRQGIHRLQLFAVHKAACDSCRNQAHKYSRGTGRVLCTFLH